MRFLSIDALVESHVQDIMDSSEHSDSAVCANVALTTLLAIIATAHAGDREKIGEDFDTMARYVRRGMDSGDLRFEVYS